MCLNGMYPSKKLVSIVTKLIISKIALFLRFKRSAMDDAMFTDCLTTQMLTTIIDLTSRQFWSLNRAK